MMIYVLVGPPASGKTTLAQTMVRYMNAVIIGRDFLREMLFGYKPEQIKAYWDREDINSLEKQINVYQDTLIRQTLAEGRDVILDNTNLRLKHINDLKKYEVPLKFILQETDFATALERDSLRSRSVGEDILRKMFGDLENLKKTFDFKDWTPEPQDEIIQNYYMGNNSTFIFDLDGTLALNTSGRSPFDWKRVGEDRPNIPVVQALHSLEAQGFDIVICSGRDAVCEIETKQWLSDHDITYHKLLMRTKGDNRKDAIVKEEMWRELVKHHNILAMFDDRQQVVYHARKLGFTVFQVAEGNF